MQTEKQDLILAIIVGSLFIVLFGFATFMVVLNYLKKKRKMLVEKEIREAYYNQGVLEAKIEMQEHTFNIISQEIHDNVGQILSLAKLNLNILTFEQKDNEAFLRIKDLVTSAISELRDLGTGYYADRLIEKGLIVAIKHQVDQLTKTGLFNISFHSELSQVAVEKNEIIFLYRIMQEVFNNVIRHSGADHVSVNILEKDGAIHIRVADNGKGFTKNSKDFKAGIGLSSIQQRATMIGATADINSQPGAGTVVNLSFKKKKYDKISFG
jgi:signal transduction histidine kinase